LLFATGDVKRFRVGTLLGNGGDDIGGLLKMSIRPNFLLIFLVGILTSCSTVKPLSVERTINGYPVKDVVVVVPESYSFKPGFVTNTLPAGMYTPAFEDDQGIYFQSPGKLLIGDILGPTLHDGGIFFKNWDASQVYEYVISGNRPTKIKVPKGLKYRIELKK
jgi:hypothetical protein